jgi:hypothetical protein
MRELVVLVGPPASGKTAWQRSHPEWVVVSKDDIRVGMFRALYETSDEETVERVYSTALVEAIGSEAEVVCVDAPHLGREERAPLIELAHLSGRRPIAHVMPTLSIDEVETAVRENVHRLRRDLPHVKVTGPSKSGLEGMLAAYARVDSSEGFYDVVIHERPVAEGAATEDVVPVGQRPRKRRERREPLPLFVS